MGNAALIPIVLPNYNVTNVSSANLSLPVGHAAFLLVQPDGSANYYEWGLYKQDQFTITHNGDADHVGSNIRALAIDAPLQFDSSGNVTTESQIPHPSPDSTL
jgi:hypothetical protein